MLPSEPRRGAEDVPLAETRPPTSDLAQIKAFQPYEYQPLDQEAQEIRLLRLLPAENLGDEIEIEIFHTPLIEPERAPDTRIGFEELRETVPEGWRLFKTREGQYIFENEDTEETQWSHPRPEIDQGLYQSDAILEPYPGFKPAYEALSYAWGEDVITAKARVVPTTAGRITTLDLRPNLVPALQHLRQTTSPRILWIDAICIDQSNFSERSREVKRMRLVYALARRVVAWLGAANESGNRGLDLVAALGRRLLYTQDVNFLNAPLVNKEDTSESFPEDIINLFTSFRVGLDTPYALNDHKSILHILDRAWWDRLWIYQEIHLASPRSLIQCGSSTRLWRHIQNAILYLSAKPPEVLNMTSSSYLNIRRRDFVYARDSNSLLFLLQNTRFAEYANPHDRIFALLGLAPPREAALINSDYSQSIVNVFRDACLGRVKVHGDLWFLHHCDWSTHGQSLGHPSWIPNWSTWCPEYIPVLQRASGLSKCRIDGIWGSQLNVDGVLCGTVEEVGREAPSHGDMEATLRSWEAIARLTGDGWPERFIETLACGDSEEAWPDRGYPTLEQYWKAYFNTDKEPLLSERIRGRPFFRYSDVELGICPSGAKIGDLVVVILGCDLPMVLRRSSLDQDPATYVVVGPAYVSNLEHSQALLGSLPDAVRMRIEVDWQGVQIQEFENVNGRIIYDDPRLGPLPDGWKFLKEYDPTQKEQRRFVNPTTGKMTFGDPRLTPEELRKRGMKVEEFVLV